MNRNATRLLAGRREGDLLAFPSVRRMTDVLAQRCRESSWVRTSVASLERFRVMTGYADLEALREQALAEPATVSELIALCGCLPLALCDVAARAVARPGLPLATISAKMRDARRRLDALGFYYETHRHHSTSVASCSWPKTWETDRSAA